MVHSEFPLQRLVQLASSPFQVGFARQVVRMLPPSPVAAYEPTRDGLLILAGNEAALRAQTEMLCGMYGDDLLPQPPQVRYISLGNRPYEPIMRVRVRVAGEYRDAVCADLAEREALLLGERARAGACLLRAEAPLRTLLGYGEALAGLAAGATWHRTVLDRYVPMPRPPGGRVA